MAEEDIITFEANDGEFCMEFFYGKTLTTIRDVVEDTGTEHPIPVPNINVETLEHIYDYLKAESGNAVLSDNVNEDLKDWEIKYYKDLGEDWVDVITSILKAVNYLNHPRLTKACVKYMASQVAGKTTVEIRDIFNIQSDFTKEEEEQLRSENEWAKLR